MKVIGYRKESVYLINVFTIVIAIALLIIDFTILKELESLFIVLLAVAMMLYSFYQIINYFMTPKYPIKYEDKNLYLPKNVVVSLKEITDVSYRFERVKGGHFTWGKVFIITNEKRYQINFVKDCDKVSKEINSLISNLKNFDEEY